MQLLMLWKLRFVEFKQVEHKNTKLDQYAFNQKFDFKLIYFNLSEITSLYMLYPKMQIKIILN